MPSIAQQDYIIIDWEGLGADAAKAELRKLFKTNPLSLFSVIIKGFFDGTNSLNPVQCVAQEGDDEFSLTIWDNINSEDVRITISLL